MVRLTLCLVTFGCLARAGADEDWLLPNFAQRLEVEISNPSGSGVETIGVVPVEDALRVASGFPGRVAIAVVAGAAPTILPFQVDDLDGDGAPDEVVFPVKLVAGESRKVHIYYSTTLRDRMIYPKRVHAQHNFGYNHQTVSLESELVGYRTYGGFFLDFQARAKGQPGLYNGFVGYFGSITPVVGRDVTHLGDTLGLGGMFLRLGKQIFRPPMNVPDYAHKPSPPAVPHYRVISDGPVRAVVEARMDRWRIGEDEVAIRATYVIVAGSSHVECGVRVTPLHIPPLHIYEVGAGIRHLPQMRLGHGSGRLMLSGTQNKTVGPLAFALYFEPSEAAPISALITRKELNEAIVFSEKLQAGRAVDVHYRVAAAWSGSGITDLLSHLQEVERQARGVVHVGGFKFTPTPAPERVESEAY
ncbi:MAG: DUF4861 family protein [Bryobacteraceae bacterium]